ncbi:MAG: endo-1,4-beta-xylanase [Phycisphaerales bacterium]|nr:endo-1,4-beta-xylanase [Phycisphaerales bacterium]
MLAFAVTDRLAPSTQGVLPGASVVGPDSVPVNGSALFENGLIRCEKTNAEAAALSLQINLDAGALASIGAALLPDGTALRPMGELVLQTCLLPDRDRPYLLSLELARHRVMLILNKLEEWQAFDMLADDPAMPILEKARDAFTQALVALPRNAGDTGLPDDEADRLALRALWIALEASERLAMRQAQIDFGAQARADMHAQAADDLGAAQPVLHPTRSGLVLPQPPAVGVTISPLVYSDAAKQLATRCADFITMPMRWIEMEPAEGEYAFARTDRWIEWAVRSAKLPVVAGPVIDFRPHAVPEWLYIWENDYDTLRELVYEHMKAVVTRYRRTVTRWTVCSGLHANRNFSFTFEQMIDLTRICVLVTRKLHPKAKVQIEIVEPWGEHHSADRRSLPPTLYAEMLAQAGVQFDALALRVQMGVPRPGLGTRDLMAFSAMLDQYAALDRPVALSAVGVPAAPVPHEPEDEDALPRSGGSWRQPWSTRAQADWASAYLAVALAKPYVQSVCWQDLADPPDSAEMPLGALADAGGAPRPVAERFADLRASIAKGQMPEPVGLLKAGARAATPQPAG